MNTLSEAPEIIEGSWEDIIPQDGRLNGRHVRLIIFKESQPATGRYAARILQTLDDAAMPDQSEIDESERDVNELTASLNDTRRREGAEPLF